jgi:hypothetical protein
MYKNYRIVVAAFLHDPTVTISKLKCCNGQLIVDSRKVHSWLHTDIVDSACEHTRKVQSLFQCDQGIVLGKAFDRFDCYPDAVLNVAIDLKSALPIGSAVYDMIVPDIIKISTSTASGVEVFDLLVAGPQRHRVLLHQSTWPAHDTFLPCTIAPSSRWTKTNAPLHAPKSMGHGVAHSTTLCPLRSVAWLLREGPSGRPN